jgi:dTDP-4-dehydrorhamnose reductase
MRVLVLGAGGMLGHRLCLEWAGRFDCMATTRGAPPTALAELLGPERLIEGIAIETGGAPAGIADAIERSGCDVVVNCIGIVKQSLLAQDAITSISVNSLYPHRLAALCRDRAVRLIHISTDCVFSGHGGSYTEDSPPDPVDLYGRSKLLGEVDAGGALTLRTSIIGRELSGTFGLVEWLISSRGGSVKGFTRAIFNGFTTSALAAEIGALIEQHPDLQGLRHISADPIDKFSLLSLLDEAFGLDIEIEADDGLVIDRSLDSSRLRRETGRIAPDWRQMVSDLAREGTAYDEIRQRLT